MRMARSTLGSLVLLAWTGCMPRAASVAPVMGTEWTTLGGERRSISSMMGDKATVFITMDPECPICELYAHAFQDLADAYAAKGVAVIGVYSGPFMERGKARAYSAQAGFAFPQVMDSACALSLALRARVTPECFVVDPGGTVVYHGALDDRPLRQGRKKLEAHRNYLAEALDAYLAGGGTQPEVAAVGCIVECEE